MNCYVFLCSLLIGNVALVKTTLLFLFLCIYSSSRDSTTPLWGAAWSAPGASTVMVIPPSSLVPGEDVWNTLYHASSRDAPVLLPMPLDSYHVFLVDAKNVGQSHANASFSRTTITEEKEERVRAHPLAHDGNATSPWMEKERSTDEPEEEIGEMWPLRHRISTIHMRADYVARAAAAARSPLSMLGERYEKGEIREPPHAYIPSFLLQPLSLVSNLSDTWEVVADDSVRFQRLLHCRVPYRKTASMVRAEEAKLIATYEESMAIALKEWWEEYVIPEGGEGLFGNGDVSGARIWTWYVLCPMDGFYRVHSELLRAAVVAHNGFEVEEEREKKEAYVERWRTCQADFPYQREMAVADTTKNEPRGLQGLREEDPHRPWRSPRVPFDAPLSHGEKEVEEVLVEEVLVEEENRHTPRSHLPRRTGGKSHGESHPVKKGKRLKRPAARPSDAGHSNNSMRSTKEEEEEEEEEKEKQKRKMEIDQAVRAFQNEHLRCTPSFHKLLESPSEPLFHIAITKVGTYRPHGTDDDGDHPPLSPLLPSRHSTPRWNADLRAFEMWYPSSTPCMEGRIVRPTTTPTSSSSESDDTGRYWKTRFVFRCLKSSERPFLPDLDAPAPEAPPHHKTPGGQRQAGSPGSHAYSPWWSGGGDGMDEDEAEGSGDTVGKGTITWSITELRQECLMEVELASSGLVCLWDSYLDQVRLNPIPCVEIV